MKKYLLVFTGALFSTSAYCGDEQVPPFAKNHHLKEPAAISLNNGNAQIEGPAVKKSPALKTIYRSPPNENCSVNGGGFPGAHCNVDAKITAEPGWVACKWLGVVVSGRNSTYSISHMDVLPGDTQNPPRYKTYHFSGLAQSGNWADPYGSNVGINGFGMVEINVDATLQDRWDYQCEL